MNCFVLRILAIGLVVSAGAVADDVPAIAALKQQAEEGDDQAAISLGIRYRDGRGVERDNRQALRWFRDSADKGNAAGMDNVGFMYLKGRGVPPNEDIAAAYFKAGAARGSAQAQFNLGTCHFSGRGVEQDYASAIEAWQQAAQQGHDNSIWRLAMMHASGEGIARDCGRARELCRAIAERGHVSGMLLLGELHEQGEHGEARRWWTEAAGKGSPQGEALLRLSQWRRLDPVPGGRAYVAADHIYQGWNNCGATSVAMFARHAGSDASPYDVKRLCPASPIGTGTDWEHLVAAGEEIGQRWEMLAFANDDDGFAEGTEVIRQQLDAGRPVVIDFTVIRDRNGKEERFGHTLLVVGYNLELDQFVLKNPNQPSPGIQLMSAEELKANWFSSGYSRLARGEVGRPLIVVAGR